MERAGSQPKRNQEARKSIITEEEMKTFAESLDPNAAETLREIEEGKEDVQLEIIRPDNTDVDNELDMLLKKAA